MKATAGAQQMKMLRRLPKILRFIPGTAQDVRAYFLTLQYWLAGSEANVANMVCVPGRPLCRRAAQASLRGTTKPQALPADLPRGRRLPPAHAGSGCRRRLADLPAWPPPASARHGRPAADALLPAGRQHRPLRRRHHGDGSARPARRSCVRDRAGFARPAIDASSSSTDGRPSDRCAGLADRLLAGRRAGLQRREGRRGHPGQARRALPRRHAGGVPDAGPMGRIAARPAAGGSDHDGGHP